MSFSAEQENGFRSSEAYVLRAYRPPTACINPSRALCDFDPHAIPSARHAVQEAQLRGVGGEVSTRSCYGRAEPLGPSAAGAQRAASQDLSFQENTRVNRSCNEQLSSFTPLPGEREAVPGGIGRVTHRAQEGYQLGGQCPSWASVKQATDW